MKSLYESILDDEEVLIEKTRGIVKNHLVCLKQLFHTQNNEERILNYLNLNKDYFSKFFKKMDDRLVWEYHNFHGLPGVYLVDTKGSKSRGLASICPIVIEYTSDSNLHVCIDYNYFNSKLVSNNVKYDELLKFAENIAKQDIQNSNNKVRFTGSKNWTMSAII
jgi:hypothetical protein